MTYKALTAAACILAGHSAGQTELLLTVVPEPAIAEPGDVVTWTFFAELLDPDPTKTIGAVVSIISFDMVHSDTSGFVIMNNEFNPAFDSDFFGPADDGVIVGTEIIGASGSNTLPPLNNAGGPDDRNPLPIYSYETLITDPTPRTVIATPRINGQFDGAYVGDPFYEIITYQNANGTNGTTPFRLPNLIEQPFLTVIPAPSSTLPLIGLALIARRRRH